MERPCRIVSRVGAARCARRSRSGRSSSRSDNRARRTRSAPPARPPLARPAKATRRTAARRSARPRRSPTRRARGGSRCGRRRGTARKRRRRPRAANRCGDKRRIAPPAWHRRCRSRSGSCGARSDGYRAVRWPAAVDGATSCRPRRRDHRFGQRQARRSVHSGADCPATAQAGQKPSSPVSMATVPPATSANPVGVPPSRARPNQSSATPGTAAARAPMWAGSGAAWSLHRSSPARRGCDDQRRRIADGFARPEIIRGRATVIMRSTPS